MTSTTAAAPASARQYTSLIAGRTHTAPRSIDRFAPGNGVKVARVNAADDGIVGGYKASGYGREMGQAGFDEYTTLKSVNIRTGRRAGTFAITAPRAARQ